MYSISQISKYNQYLLIRITIFYLGDLKIDQKLLEIQNNKDKLNQLKDFNEIFDFVKTTVSIVFKMNRTGLNLILQGMPSSLGAYHVLGSNVIVANRYILEYIQNTKSKEEYNSYIFAVLAHEYLHSLGITDENKVRKMTYKLCLDIFGMDHITAKFANNPLNAFPQLQLLANNKFDKSFMQIKKFDDKNISYIG
jgi:hypothetical protein